MQHGTWQGVAGCAGGEAAAKVFSTRRHPLHQGSSDDASCWCGAAHTLLQQRQRTVRQSTAGKLSTSCAQHAYCAFSDAKLGDPTVIEGRLRLAWARSAAAPAEAWSARPPVLLLQPAAVCGAAALQWRQPRRPQQTQDPNQHSARPTANVQLLKPVAGLHLPARCYPERHPLPAHVAMRNMRYSRECTYFCMQQTGQVQEHSRRMISCCYSHISQSAVHAQDCRCRDHAYFTSVSTKACNARTLTAAAASAAGLT
jgi:hypothetical protein